MNDAETVEGIYHAGGWLNLAENQIRVVDQVPKRETKPISVHKHITETETIERFIGADESLKLRLMLMPFSTLLYENKASFHLIGVIQSRMQKKIIYIYRDLIYWIFLCLVKPEAKRRGGKKPPLLPLG